MSSQAEPGPGVTFMGERPSIDAPELPSKPYEFVMETEVESLDKMHKVGRHRKFEIHVDEPACISKATITILSPSFMLPQAWGPDCLPRCRGTRP